MVKGVSRQVIVVKSPDPRFFEEAIFIVRGEALSRDGVSPESVLSEACRAADGYVRRNVRGARGVVFRLAPGLCAAAGAAATALVWFLTVMFL